MNPAASHQPDVSVIGIPHIGRATLVGMAVGFLTISVPVAVGLFVLGGGSITFLAASHVGFFGGMGFGGMLGAVIRAGRFEDREAIHRPTVIASPETLLVGSVTARGGRGYRGTRRARVAEPSLRSAARR